MSGGVSLCVQLFTFASCALAHRIVRPPGPFFQHDVRLVNDLDSAPFMGRVEVYVDGEWGTVCDDSFRSVCRRDL